jgi:hypothetical protein
MATEYLWKVLYSVGSEDQVSYLPLVKEVHFFDYASQEYGGIGFIGDFDQTEDRGEAGEIWYFVSYSETAMEAALNDDQNVLRYALVATA